MIGEIIERVKREMTGRMADEFGNVRMLMEAVRDAGDGDYLEIGVLHGGSLCAVALLKKALGHKGICVGIDPLNGYYIDYAGIDKRAALIEPLTKLPVTYDIVHENIKKFRLDNVEILIASSDPLPMRARHDFAVVYIDGDHWGDAPIIDWCNVKDYVTHFVVLDNHDKAHPDVMRACRIAEQDERWERHVQQGITFIVRRVK